MASARSLRASPETWGTTRHLPTQPSGRRGRTLAPGAIISEWNRIAREGLTKYSSTGGYRDSAGAYAKFMEGADGGWLPSPPAVVAKTIVKAVGASRPKTRYAIGGGARMVLFTRRLLSDRAFDALMLMGARPVKPKRA